MTKQFFVYTHKKPDGSPFYVGKGLLSRAYDFAPSRRTSWHKNVVAKHGRENIIVEVILCDSEESAFRTEVETVAALRAMGFHLCNLTSGGEGVSGRAVSEKQLAGLEKGRRKGKRGVKGPRKEFSEWLESDAGKMHCAALGKQGAIRLHSERLVNCCQCGIEFTTRSAKAKACSRLCEQRHRRAKDAGH